MFEWVQFLNADFGSGNALPKAATTSIPKLRDGCVFFVDLVLSEAKDSLHKQRKWVRLLLPAASSPKRAG
jgi:hypothetical protein